MIIPNHITIQNTNKEEKAAEKCDVLKAETEKVDPKKHISYL